MTTWDFSTTKKHELFQFSYSSSRSRYTLDDSLISCSIDFNAKSIDAMSFNVALFGCVFFIPLALIIGINIKTLLLVSSDKKANSWSIGPDSKYAINVDKISHTNQLSVITRNTYAYTKRMQNEKKLTISAFVVVGKLSISVINALTSRIFLKLAYDFLKKAVSWCPGLLTPCSVWRNPSCKTSKSCLSRRYA